jgi:hypothetical protein
MPTRIEDLLDLDSLLTPEDIELRQTVRRFGEQRLRPRTSPTGSRQVRFPSASWPLTWASSACWACT